MDGANEWPQWTKLEKKKKKKAEWTKWNYEANTMIPWAAHTSEKS